MKPIDGFRLITPDELTWRPSNLMGIPNADYLERTGSELLGARLWRLPPKSANTLHRHIIAEEFYFVLEGTGRMRIADTTLTIPRHGGVLVGPSQLRQIFNDSDADVLWLIIGAPEKETETGKVDLKQYYPVEPTQLPPELKNTPWPRKSRGDTDKSEAQQTAPPDEASPLTRIGPQSMNSTHSKIVADGAERLRGTRDFAEARRALRTEVTARHESEMAQAPLWRRLWIAFKIRREISAELRRRFPPSALHAQC